ncbi:MAG TPA: 5-oxoprolinase subunit PxpA [Chloroflexia bacterium]|nr:5-oxoprolinase subunit PxpA [Chloroflexia bacterium]
MKRTIDLNCDMGEGYGRWTLGQDQEMMRHISSANIACGFHAGDPLVMSSTLALAAEHEVSVGAHPGYPDLQGFGRRNIAYRSDEIAAMVLYQIGALAALARVHRLEVRHVKPHGALYNTAGVDRHVAEATVQGILNFSKDLYLYCLPGSLLEEAGSAFGLRIVPEGFADRAYEPNGSLADRSVSGSVLTVFEAVAQALSLCGGAVTTTGGNVLEQRVSTICVHGDTDGAAQIAKSIRAALLKEGISVEPPSRS